MSVRTSLEPLRSDFIIGYRRDRLGGMKAPHLHNQYEMFLCLSDHVNCLIENRIFHIDAGTLVLFDCNCLHKVTVPDNLPYIRYVINFSKSLIENFSSECVSLLDCFRGGYNIIPLSGRDLQRTKSLFVSLHALYGSGSGNCGLKLKLLLSQLLVEINQPVLYSQPPSEASFPEIGAVLSYISENYADRIYINDLCRRFYISRSALTAKFRSATGTTVNSYITGQRLSKASELLLRGESVSAVCEKCGFPDQSHFTRVFSARFGCPPGRYARQNKPSAQPMISL